MFLVPLRSRSHTDLFPTSWKWLSPWRVKPDSIKAKYHQSHPVASTVSHRFFFLSILLCINRSSGAGETSIVLTTPSTPNFKKKQTPKRQHPDSSLHWEMSITAVDIELGLTARDKMPHVKNRKAIFFSPRQNTTHYVCTGQWEERTNSLHLYITPAGLQREITVERDGERLALAAWLRLPRLAKGWAP